MSAAEPKQQYTRSSTLNKVGNTENPMHHSKLLSETPQTSPFVMMLNFKHSSIPIKRSMVESSISIASKITYSPEIIKVLRLPQHDPFHCNRISCLNFGPYDNGYIILGTTSGHLMVLDPKNLKRISSEKVFDGDGEGVTQIQYEPTQMVFIGSNKGKVKAINIIPQQMAYVYLDLGKDEYCTVALDRKNSNSANEMQRKDSKVVDNQLCCL